jgi:hypothetical protein
MTKFTRIFAWTLIAIASVNAAPTSVFGFGKRQGVTIDPDNPDNVCLSFVPSSLSYDAKLFDCEHL